MSVIYKPIRVLPPPLNPQDEGKPVESISLKRDKSLPEGFFYTENHPINREGFTYRTATATAALPNVIYTYHETPGEKCGPDVLDKSTKVAMKKDGTLTCKQGYCSCRANVGITAGEWYYEIEIVKSNEQTNDSHVRIGLARREFDLETPVGSDAYSYGIQDKGKKVHIGRPKDFMGSFKSGDVIGFHVSIPRAYPHTLPYLVRRDRFPIRLAGHLFCETLDYVPTKTMKELLVPKPGIELAPSPGEFIPGSFVKVYKNGELQGTAFENLREILPPFSSFDKQHRLLPTNNGFMGYYPTISCYREGQAKFSMGPDFAYPKPETARPICELWEARIADDVVYDLIDQVHYEINDPLDDTKIQGTMPEWVDQFTPVKPTRPVKDEVKSEGPDTKRQRSIPAEERKPKKLNVKSEQEVKPIVGTSGEVKLEPAPAPLEEPVKTEPEVPPATSLALNLETEKINSI